MKNFLNTMLIMLLTTTSVWSQEEDIIKQNPKAQEKIRAARVAYITERLKLTPEEAEKFWPVYREFVNKRTDLRKQVQDARKNPNPKKTEEQNQKDLIELDLQIKQKELDLEKQYSTRILNVLPAQKFAALRIAEEDFRRLVLRQIQQRQMQEQRRQQFQERNDQRLRQRNN